VRTRGTVPVRYKVPISELQHTHAGYRRPRYDIGYLPDIPVDSFYSGVIWLRSIIFIAELNGLPTWSTDIGNAYLEAKTLERVCIIAGPEFDALQGHNLVIVKALYGLRSSGLRWHERFADCLRNEGFFPCKAEPGIWMKAKGDHYEYIGVYVDNLAFAMKDPQGFANTLEKKYNFKLKGTGELSFHLGCDFYRDDNGILCMSPRKYIDRMIDNYTRMFGEKPRLNVMSVFYRVWSSSF
jgi:Reverse transcriptase (RNA-dependent DNA polymerase)